MACRLRLRGEGATCLKKSAPFVSQGERLATGLALVRALNGLKAPFAKEWLKRPDRLLEGSGCGVRPADAPLGCVTSHNDRGSAVGGSTTRKVPRWLIGLTPLGRA